MGFIKWHKSVLEKVQEFMGLSNYQVMWIAWVKGIVLGMIITYFLMK